MTKGIRDNCKPVTKANCESYYDKYLEDSPINPEEFLEHGCSLYFMEDVEVEVAAAQWKKGINIWKEGNDEETRRKLLHNWSNME